MLSNHLELSCQRPILTKWHTFIESISTLHDAVNIAIVGKYVNLPDAYKSITEALIHAQAPNNTRVMVNWIDAEQLTSETTHHRLENMDGILVPGGFGDRGVKGKIAAAQYAREHKVPYFGICLGMQVAVIEFARNVLGLKEANSTEFDASTPFPVIDLMQEQKSKKELGGTLRLGSSRCTLKRGSAAETIYGINSLTERHRHRYEFNTQFISHYEENGFVVTGYNELQQLPEMIEIPSNPFFIACQFHPEFKSKPFAPHPLFVAFVKAASAYKKNLARHLELACCLY